MFHIRIHRRLTCCSRTMTGWLLLFVMILSMGISDVAADDIKSKKSSHSKTEIKKSKAKIESESKAKSDKKKVLIAKLIQQLGDDQFTVRQRAGRQLLKIGFEAIDALSEAQYHPDTEISLCARYLIKMIKVPWVNKNDLPELNRLMRDYGDRNERDRTDIIKNVSAISNHAGVAILCRISRYDKSEILSKIAAIVLITDHQATFKKQPKLLRSAIDSSRRKGPLLIEAYLIYVDNPQQGIKQWGKLVDAELELIKKDVESTNTSLLKKLVELQVDMLTEQKLKKEALTAIRRRVSLSTIDTASLFTLIRWLKKQKAWSTLEDVENRFKEKIAKEPLLLYVLAETYVAREKKKKAAELAQRALQFSPKSSTQHLYTAFELYERGLLQWAVMEYKQVIKIAPAASNQRVSATWLLAILLSDQQQYQEGGKLLKQLIVEAEKDAALKQVINDENGLIVRLTEREGMKVVKSKMHLFFALHNKSEKQSKKTREHLNQAILLDSTDADILIEIYQLPNPTENEKRSIRKRISTLAKKLEIDIQEQENQKIKARICNNYAWLISNTEGNLSKAIRYCQVALEIVGYDNASYLDTLAHCYFAKKDYQKAVDFQLRAVKLEPYKDVLKRSLEKFQKTLQDHKKSIGTKKAS